MKAFLAVISAFILLVIGWLFLGMLLYGIGYVAFHASDSVGLMGLLQVFLMWVLGPAFGGFLAIYVTPQIFKTVRAEIIFTGFISVLGTIVVISSLFSVLLISHGRADVGEFIMFLIQFGAVVIGAKIGKSSRAEGFV